MRSGWSGGIAMLLAASVHAAGVDPALPAYEPRAFELPAQASYVTPEGAIRIVGYNDMQDMLDRIVRRFTAAHAGVAVALHLPGTRFGPAALARGESALAPMGAEFTPPQLAQYRAQAGGDPIAFRVARASLDARALSGPFAIFVHRDNPLASLTLDQLAQVFSGRVRTWGELGLRGNWFSRPLTAYGLARGTALAYELQQRIRAGGDFGERVQGFAQSAQVVERVAADPAGIGFAAAMRATPGVRALAVAPSDGEPPVAPTEESLAAGRYPLERYLWIYAPRPLSPFAREFLRLVLSREGQEAIAASRQRYLPLSAREAAVELERLVSGAN